MDPHASHCSGGDRLQLVKFMLKAAVHGDLVKSFRKNLENI